MPVREHSSEQVEAAALALWRALFNREPKEPLRSKGGALDPSAWCMRAARAVLTEKPIPRIYSDQKAPMWVREVVEEAAHHAG